MKTAEEWQNEFPYRCSVECEGDNNEQIDTIREIQLDAMKEGMRRAAKIAEEIPYRAINDTSNFVAKNRILTAAEHLTWKDL